MRKKLFVVMLFALLAMFLPLTANTIFAQQDERERIIITFKEKMNEQILQHDAVEVHHTFPDYHAAAITVTKEAKARLKQHETVRSIETDAVVTANAQTIDWGVPKVNATKTHQLGITGKGVKVGIIDSGIHRNHPDLKIAGGVSFIESSPNYHDTNGHGTHVAGIVGARNNDIGVLGVAPDAALYAIKVIGDNGLGNHSDVIKGIEWAVKNNLDVINLSITSPQRSTIMEAALTNAYEKGLIIVAAAGNNIYGFQEPIDVLYPAKFPTVMAVGALNKNNSKADFSYYGNALEFMAPGESILSTYIPSQPNMLYTKISGTSMAAPFVTGVAALYKEAYPQLDNTGIRTLMQMNALDLGAPGRDRHFGFGLVQAPKIIEDIIFPDVLPNVWHEAAITQLYKAGMISGYPNGKFLPNKEITRAEAVTLVSRVLNIDGTPQSTIFKDVPSEHFASGYISRAHEQKIIAGYPNGNFGPNDPITRADTAVILVEAFNLANVTTSPFKDVKKDAYYEAAVHTLKGLNIATGFPDGTYRPTKRMTRAEFSVLLSKTLAEYEMAIAN